MTARDPVAIAQHWNSCAPLPEAIGTPLSTDEHAFVQSNTYDLHIVLKDGRKKVMRIDGPRRIDAFIEMATTAEDQGWDEAIARVDITEVEFA
jgi:thioesterase domain-containing protein